MSATAQYTRIPAVLAAVSAVGAAVLVLGCTAPGDGGGPGSRQEGSPAPDDTAPPADSAASPGPAAVASISPLSGGPGTNVIIRATGFPPAATLVVGLGPPASEYTVIGRTRADRAGRVETTVEIPAWVERGDGYVFVLSAPDDGPPVVSRPFHVTTAEGLVRIRGAITAEGVECPTLRTPVTDELYSLAGAPSGLEVGDGVEVTGRIAEMSICMQGTAISVERLERR